MSGSDASPLFEISVETGGIDAELVADAFRQACPDGVAIETPSRLDPATETYVPDGDSPATVKGYVPQSQDAERILRSLQLALSGAPLSRPLAWRPVQRLEETDWRESWKKYFGVQKIGRGLAIVPSWVDYTLRDGETVVRIDPGMAFGTGQHPTTAMCLRALEELGCRGRAVLDLGCGSGILAIAAALLGAERVLALDNDPQAVKSTRQNADANNVGGVVEARLSSLGEDERLDGEFDVIAANISGLTLQRLAPHLARALGPGGVVVASGFLEDAVEAVQDAFRQAGLVPRTLEADGVWRALIAAAP
jgi:ribosomal protein L11 methyltransferase